MLQTIRFLNKQSALRANIPVITTVQWGNYTAVTNVFLTIFKPKSDILYKENISRSDDRMCAPCEERLLVIITGCSILEFRHVPNER